MKHFKALLHFCTVLVCVLLIVGCTADPESQDYINIEPLYEVAIHQQLSENGGIPSLRISSLDPYPCSNAYISHHTIISEDKLQVILNDILVEGECQKEDQIVQQEVPAVTENPKLPIEISLKNLVINEGALVTKATEFELELYKFDGLKITRTNIKRIQPGMIWGYYTSDDPGSLEQISNFFTEIQDATNHQKGDYGLYYLGQDNNVTIYSAPEENYTHFLFSTASNEQEMENVLRQIKENDPSLSLRLTKYNGFSLNID